MATYLVTVKATHNGQAHTASVTRCSAVGISKTIATASGKTAGDAVARVRRDARMARVCGGLK